MAISVVGTPQSGTKTDGTDVTLSPGACLKDDILIVWGGTYNRASITPGPTGNLANFTTWAHVYTYTAGNPLFDVAWCRCTADNTPSVTCKGSGNAADGVIYCCYVLRGVNRTCLSAVAGGATGFATAGPTSGTNPDSPSANCAGVPATRSQWILSLVISNVRDTAVTVPSTPGTFVNKVGNDANSTNDYTCYGATYPLGTGTSGDPGAWGSWSTSTWLAATLILSPALETTDDGHLGLTGPAVVLGLPNATPENLCVQSVSGVLTGPQTIVSTDTEAVRDTEAAQSERAYFDTKEAADSVAVGLPEAVAGTLVDSYDGARDTDHAMGLGRVRTYDQTFTGAEGVLSSLRFYVKQGTALSGTMYAKVRDIASGTPGTDALPGSVLATSTGVSVTTLTSGYQLVRFPFEGAERITLSATNYFAELAFQEAGTVLLGGSAEKGDDGNAARERWVTGIWVEEVYTDCDIPFAVYTGVEVIAAEKPAVTGLSEAVESVRVQSVSTSTLEGRVTPSEAQPLGTDEATEVTAQVTPEDPAAVQVAEQATADVAGIIPDLIEAADGAGVVQAEEGAAGVGTGSQSDSAAVTLAEVVVAACFAAVTETGPHLSEVAFVEATNWLDVTAADIVSVACVPRQADDFNRDDGALGLFWKTPTDGPVDLRIASQKVAVSTTAYTTSAGYWDVPGNDQYSAATSVQTASNNKLYAAVRIQPSGKAWYRVVSYLSNSAVERMHPDGFVVQVQPLVTIAVGGVRLEAIGEGPVTLRVYNSSGTLLGEVVDDEEGAWLGTGYAGLTGYRTTAGGTTATMDNWVGGPIARTSGCGEYAHCTVVAGDVSVEATDDVAAGTVPLSASLRDRFNRADVTALTTPWATAPGLSADLGIWGNAAAVTTDDSVPRGKFWEVGDPVADAEARVTITSGGYSVSNWSGLCARGVDLGGGVFGAYVLGFRWSSGDYYLWRAEGADPDGWTLLATDFITTSYDNIIVGLRVTGTDPVRVEFWAATISNNVVSPWWLVAAAEDGSEDRLTGAGRTGLILGGFSVSTALTVDDFCSGPASGGDGEDEGIRVEVAVSDAAAVGTSETLETGGAVPTDTLAAGLADAADVTATLAAEETAAVVLAESASVEGVAAQTDSLAVGSSEATAVEAAGGLADSLAVGLGEAAEVLVTASVTEGVKVEPSLGRTTTASDDFNRSNAATLGPNWSTYLALPDLGVVDEQAAPQVEGGNLDYWNGATVSSDFWGEFRLSSRVGNLIGAAECLLAVSPATLNGYGAGYSVGAVTSGWSIDRYDGGVTTQLAVVEADDPAVAGSVVRLERDGENLRLYVDDQLVVSATDDTYDVAGQPLGLWAFRGTTGGEAQYWRLDDFAWGSFSGGGVSSVGTLMLAETEGLALAEVADLVITDKGEIVPDLIEASDPCAVQATEAAALDAATDGADAAGVSLSETAAGEGTGSQSESTVVGIEEAATLWAMVDPQDAAAVALAEQAAGEGAASQSDAAAAAVTEAAALFVVVVAADDLAVVESAALRGDGDGSAADETALGVSDIAAGEATGAVVDTVAIGLADPEGAETAEALFAFEEKEASDPCAVVVGTENVTADTEYLAPENVEASDPVAVAVEEAADSHDVTLAVSEFDPVGVADAVAGIATGSQADTGAVGVASAAFVDGAGSQAETVGVAGTERAAIWVEVAASDSLRTALTEAKAGTGTASQSDALRVQTSEQAVPYVRAWASDWGVDGEGIPDDDLRGRLRLTERPLVNGTASQSDALAVRTTEAATVAGTGTQADADRVALTEQAALFVTVSASEAVAVAVTSQAAGAGTGSPPDSDAVRLSEAVVVDGTASQVDALAVQIAEVGEVAEAGTTRQEVEASDPVAIGVGSETVTLVADWEAPFDVTAVDVAALQVTEAVTGSGVGSAADLPAVGVLEAPDVVLTVWATIIDASDSVGVAETDAVALGATLAVPDVAAIQTADGVAGVGSGSAADGEPVGTVEAVLIVGTATTADSDRVAATEQASAAGSTAVTETAPLGVSEAASLYVTVAAGETVACATDEAVSGVGTASAAESAALRIAETVLGEGTATASDGACTGAGETVTLVGTITLADTVTIGTTETSEAGEYIVLLALDAQDGLVVVVGDQRQVLPCVGAAEALTVGVADASGGDLIPVVEDIPGAGWDGYRVESFIPTVTRRGERLRKDPWKWRKW